MTQSKVFDLFFTEGRLHQVNSVAIRMPENTNGTNTVEKIKLLACNTKAIREKVISAVYPQAEEFQTIIFITCNIHNQQKTNPHVIIVANYKVLLKISLTKCTNKY